MTETGTADGRDGANACRRTTARPRGGRRQHQVRRAIDAVTTALADYYKPGQGVVLGTGAWLVSAARRL